MIYKYGRDIPDFVKRYREEKEISQNELGALLGVTGQYISNVERGVYANPASFCALMGTILPKDRERALFDLMMEAQAERLKRRMKK